MYILYHYFVNKDIEYSISRSCTIANDGQCTTLKEAFSVNKGGYI